MELGVTVQCLGLRCTKAQLRAMSDRRGAAAWAAPSSPRVLVLQHQQHRHQEARDPVLDQEVGEPVHDQEAGEPVHTARCTHLAVRSRDRVDAGATVASESASTARCRLHCLTAVRATQRRQK